MNRPFATIALAFTFLSIAAGMISSASGQEAHQTGLARDWTRFPPADRVQCLKLTASGLYTDLLTCLEIKRDARQIAR